MTAPRPWPTWACSSPATPRPTTAARRRATAGGPTTSSACGTWRRGAVARVAPVGCADHHGAFSPTRPPKRKDQSDHAAECIGVSQHVRKHGSNAVFSLRNNHHIAVVALRQRLERNRVLQPSR